MATYFTRMGESGNFTEASRDRATEPNPPAKVNKARSQDQQAAQSRPVSLCPHEADRLRRARQRVLRQATGGVE